MSYYIGIDVGGTNIALGIVESKSENHSDCTIISSISVKTNPKKEKNIDYQSVLHIISKGIENLIKQSKVSKEEICWVGIGIPGTCDAGEGKIIFCTNLKWRNLNIAKDLEKLCGLKVFLENDANAAAYGEYIAGAAMGASSAVVLTLGTGVGGGIILSGKIFYGENYGGGELGHMVIETTNGYPCTCGRTGCFECYASGTALKRMTSEAISKYPNSRMREITDLEGRISAKTAFIAQRLGDEIAQKVVDNYVRYLSVGIANIVAIFHPEVICIGGGVGNEGENLFFRIRTALSTTERVSFSRSEKHTKIIGCSLGDKAGIIGASMLGFHKI